ncbi:PilW family protein [Paenibacillus albus]|nr:prepilin-type N-terminal cleavage/methylation domain-containing protein [Paenibacillus albus]
MIGQKVLNSRGLTLLELLAAIVILALVLSVAVPVMLIGVRTYSGGQEKSSLHDQVQLASMMLTKELRYAKEVSIVSAAACPASGFNCIYTGSVTPKSILKKSSTGVTSNFIKDVKGKQSIQATFSYTTGNLLEIDIQGDVAASARTYKIQTKIVLLNMTAITGLASGQAIQYK